MDAPPAISSDTPEMSVIDTVIALVDQRMGFYRTLAIGAASIVLVLIALVSLTTQPSAWLSWAAKLGSGASAVVGIAPVTAYLKWRGLSALCSNYRQLVVLRTQTPGSISDAAFARMSASFWRLYETSWEVSHE